MVWLNVCPVAVAILEEVALYLQICNGYFYQVSESWPMDLVFKTTSDFLIDQKIFFTWSFIYCLTVFIYLLCLKYSRLSLSRTPRDSMNISRYPYFDISDLRNWGKQFIEQSPLTEWVCNLTPELEIYWKYCGKEEKLLLRSNFSSFPQYFVACW